MWRNYNEGSRNYCGIPLPDNLIKNQKLDTPLVTPTTKADVDELISNEEILQRNILTKEELDYINDISLKLYNLGVEIAQKHNLILVDTKYEFGKTSDGRIILIDEVHTPDSSRFWKLDTYQSLFDSNKNPEGLDKDHIRNYVLENPDYESIPEELITRVISCYTELYKNLSNENVTALNNFSDLQIVNDIQSIYSDTNLNFKRNNDDKKIVILYGSPSDIDHINNIKKKLDEQELPYEAHQASAHKQINALLKILDENVNNRCLFITVAGLSNALSGVVAGYTNRPVISCPPFKDNVDMSINLASSMQCPSKVPVMTILNPTNVAISCRRIFDL